MNSFELNKVLGAILGTCLVLLALNIGANALFHTPKPAKPGYLIAVKTSSPAAKPAVKKAVPIAVLLQHADPAKGKQIARQCEARHTLGKGEPNKIGPNLWNIVGNLRGEDRNGFHFSDAMKKKGGKWTYEELNKFLAGPRNYIPGTAMTFAGLPRDDQRADVIAYLRTLSDNPEALPKPPAKAPAPTAAPTAKPAEKKTAAPATESLAELLEHASVEKGKGYARQCQACHTLTKGGANRVGPNLWNIVGSARGEDRNNFNFSAAMKKKGGKWTYDELFKFLKGPRNYIPGTAMTFAGIDNPQHRADVIAYLRTLSDKPLPLPKH